MILLKERVPDLKKLRGMISRRLFKIYDLDKASCINVYTMDDCVRHCVRTDPALQGLNLRDYWYGPSRWDDRIDQVKKYLLDSMRDTWDITFKNGGDNISIESYYLFVERE